VKTSENVARIEPSATLAIAARARDLAAQGVDVIDLSAGEPDFDTPEFIADAAVEAIRAGRTRYTAVGGVAELRSAIARELEGGRDVHVDPTGIVVSTGAKQALFNVCFCLFGRGDQVLVPTPYWTSYPDIITLARAEPVPVRGPEANAFKVGPADLEDAAVGGAVRGLLLNSPTNPTGAVYSRQELAAILDWAHSRGIAVISDEIYNRICYDAERAPGLLDLGPLRDGDVVIGGASKNYAMTGWRIGYSYASREITASIAAVQSHTTSNPNTPAQYAALAAFSARGDAAARGMAGAFQRRRDMLVSRFRELLPEVAFVPPHGAFYVFFRVDRFFRTGRSDSVAFCQWLLEETAVALVPGAAFGDDRFVRLSFATDEMTIERGIARLAEALTSASTAGAGAG
jgi:aspartate aminotransferase